VPPASQSRGFVLVPAVDRAARALELLAEESILSISDVARRLDVSKSVARNLLETLREHNFVERDSATKLYRLGGQLLRLGGATPQARLDLGPLARPYLEELAAETGEVALLVVPHGAYAVFVERIESSHLGPRLSVPVGWRIPLGSASSGKVFRAYDVPLVERDDSTPLSDTEAARIREIGYALDDSQHIEGIRAAAAPVFDATQRVVAAVVVLGIAPTLRSDRLTDVGTTVARCAARISRALGSPPNGRSYDALRSQGVGRASHA